MKTMTDEERMIAGLKQIENMDRRRGHATFWNADNKSQCWMEVDATSDWAEKMDSQGHSIPICKIKKNLDDPPDVFAEMDGEKIGIEVTELVDEQAIGKHPEIPPLVELVEPGPHALDRLPQPMPPKWTLEKFERHLRKIVQRKEEKVRKKHKRDGKDNSLSKRFLLIVTDQDYLLDDEATLPAYLKTIELQRLQSFDGVYIMGSPDGEDHYPVFEIPVAR